MLGQDIEVKNASVTSAARRLLNGDFRQEPYWWTAAPPEEFSDGFPDSTDVLIVGSGVTGTSAAYHLAKLGHQADVLDANLIGSGAARRNAGFLSRTLKKTFTTLARSHGEGFADAAFKEVNHAFDFVTSLIRELEIDCALEPSGRLVMATSPAHLTMMIDTFNDLHRQYGTPYEVVSEADIHREVGTTHYHGAVLIPGLAKFHPGLFHSGFVNRARSAGARFHARTKLERLKQTGNGFVAHTTRGTIRARQVLIATNGYNDNEMPWLKPRLAPFSGHMLATEELSPQLLRRLLPTNRGCTDSNTNLDYFHLAPGENRLLFGGRTGATPEIPLDMAWYLHRRMCRVFPELEDVRVSRLWSGKCAGTYDLMPHVGERNGVFFASGYNFAGTPIGALFGKKVADAVATGKAVDSIFATTRMPRFPLPVRRCGGVRIVMTYLDVKDWLIARGIL
ncbi:FAD-binding oxidoreductase [Roseovarius sp.]|uniref:NAD(P)/FAD-dependent oxidoreductase n=1 Tax=Roseovarius sp. TaxID=1486281 RepID=UPI0026332413|nr:FAD-binding oxidoreductase [Roseovarius sp.]MDM8165599.1 FAD-binding oxidoreductase [Roseovarius sp.]